MAGILSSSGAMHDYQLCCAPFTMSQPKDCSWRLSGSQASPHICLSSCQAKHVCFASIGHVATLSLPFCLAVQSLLSHLLQVRSGKTPKHCSSPGMCLSLGIRRKPGVLQGAASLSTSTFCNSRLRHVQSKMQNRILSHGRTAAGLFGSVLQACPCTQQSLCEMDNLNMFTDCNWNYWRPGFWYFIHGGMYAYACRWLFLGQPYHWYIISATAQC